MADELTPVTQEQAHEAVHRFIASHFSNKSGLGPQARFSIPARPDYDDDLMLSRFIDQYAALEARARAAEADADRLALKANASSAQFWILDHFIQKLIAPGNREAASQVLHLNEIRSLRDELATVIAQHAEAVRARGEGSGNHAATNT